MVRKILETTIGISLIVMVILVVLEVFARYVRISIPWTEEAARYLLVAVTFLGAAIAIREGSHIKITTLFEKFSENTRLYLILGFTAAMLAFIIAAFWGSIILIRGAWTVPTASMPVFKMGYIYLILPISILFMGGYLLVQMVENAQKLLKGGKS